MTYYDRSDGVRVLYQIDGRYVSREEFMYDAIMKISRRLTEIEKRLPPPPPKAE